MSLGISQKLILGNLQLIYPDKTTINYFATSGLPDYQRPDDQWLRGKGPIPDKDYQMSAEPYWLETRGVEGLFFHITPDPVGEGDRLSSDLSILTPMSLAPLGV